MKEVSTIQEKNARKYHVIDRTKQAEIIQEVIRSGKTRQVVADEYGIPKSTLQSWLQRTRELGGKTDPEVVAFYESAAGISQLHLIMAALFFVFHATGCCGIPHLQKFLRLCRLDLFVGSSIGTLHQFSTEIHDLIRQFGKEESERLAKDMPFREITNSLDENFILEVITLILMEPESGYILAEQIEEKRDASTWFEVAESALKGLNVKIVQLTGDEGTGLTKFATELLGVHKSPDLFHVQQDISKGLMAELTRRVKKLERIFQEANKTTSIEMDLQSNFQSDSNDSSNSDGSSPWSIKKLVLEEDKLAEMARSLEEAKENLQAAQKARRTITNSYHPFDLNTGEIRTPEQLKQELAAAHIVLETIAEKTGCTEYQKKKLSKAKKMIEPMVDTLSFFYNFMHRVTEGLGLNSEEKKAFEKLVALEYLDMVLRKTPNKELKRIIKHTIENLKESLFQRDGPWNKLCLEKQSILREKAKACASIFQRSSSCVEGRNGVLSLKHHALHRLSPDKLAVLTALHNFFYSRRDGTTAAERFFGKKQRNLFDWILDRISMPVRPRKGFLSTKEKKYMVA